MAGCCNDHHCSEKRPLDSPAWRQALWIALAVNAGMFLAEIVAGVALLLYRFRDGDANMRSVWICSRNDAIGNVAVLLAAAGVFGTGTGWPDLIVASIMAGLGISGGWQIVRQATAELRSASAALPIAAE